MASIITGDDDIIIIEIEINEVEKEKNEYGNGDDYERLQE
jgi:hypothetical protein